MAEFNISNSKVEQINDQGDNYKISGTKGTVSVPANSVSTGGGSINTGGGAFVQARDITRSFNEIAERAEKPQVAEKLRQLALSLNEILVNLSEEQAEKVRRDAETFAAEAADKTPRKTILDVLGSALLGTVRFVAVAAEPVITPIVTAVIAAALV